MDRRAARRVGHRLLRAPRDRRQPDADRRRAARPARREPTRCSCAAGSARPRTTSPATRSPSSWACRSCGARSSPSTSRRCSAPACRDMPQNNLRQADVPEGGDAIPNPIGTAPGLRVRAVGDGKVVYAVPGVPYEMQQMVTEHVLPDLLRAVGRGGGDRVALAEDVGHVGVGARRDDRRPRVDAQTATRRSRSSPAASRASSCASPRRRATEAEARALVDAEETRAARDPRRPRVRRRRRDDGARGARRACAARGWTLGVAESLTGGLIGARIANVPGASDTFRGTIASYATEVKRVGARRHRRARRERGVARSEMAEGAQRVLGADVGIAVTGVAGPDRAGRRSRSARCASAIALPGTTDRGGQRRGCPATASGSASSRRSRCSTCCGSGSTRSP